MKILKLTPRENQGFTYVDMFKNTLKGRENEIVVTNRVLLEQAEGWFRLRRKQKLEKFEEYKQYFRSIEGLEPIYDMTGSQLMPICFKDTNSNLYDLVYDRKTFELIPLSAFTVEQFRCYFLGLPGSTKTLKAISYFKFLSELARYLPKLTWYNDYTIDSAEYEEVDKMALAFENGMLPDITHRGSGFYPVPIRIDNEGKSLLLEFVAQAGEELRELNRMNTMFDNPNSMIAFVIPGEEMLDILRGHRTGSISLLERFNAYGMRYGGAKNTQRFALVISKADLLQDCSNSHIQKILAKNTVYRDENQRIAFQSEGVLDIEEMNWMQSELWEAIKESNAVLYNELRKIQNYMAVNLFLNADLNESAVDNKFEPDMITPFRTDEFFKFLLFTKGMIKAKGEAEEKGNNRTRKFLKFLQLNEENDEWEEEDDDDEEISNSFWKKYVGGRF